MIDEDDLVQMRADMAEVRGDNEVSVIIRRGTTTLAAQTVRIARQGSQALQRDSAGAQQAMGAVVVLGKTTLDIQPEDRFTVDGLLYQVTFMRPNRHAATMAEAQAIK